MLMGKCSWMVPSSMESILSTALRILIVLTQLPEFKQATGQIANDEEKSKRLIKIT